MRESVRERTRHLDGIAAKLYTNEAVAETMGLLEFGEQERRGHRSPESWKQCIRLNCRQHYCRNDHNLATSDITSPRKVVQKN